jgi:hypothetical protein
MKIVTRNGDVQCPGDGNDYTITSERDAVPSFSGSLTEGDVVQVIDLNRSLRTAYVVNASLELESMATDQS